jgi:phage baseplate assembly protein W
MSCRRSGTPGCADRDLRPTAGDWDLMDVDFPYAIDSRGRTASTEADDHIHDLVEQVLFTAPGERVNRPEFGGGLLQLVFAPNSDELTTATQFLVQGALQRWLGELIEVNAVEVGNEDSTLRVRVVYTIRRTQERRTAQFSRGF